MPDPSAVADKRAFEEETAGWVKRMAASQGEGDYQVELVGSYPDTLLRIAGRNVRTSTPSTWQFSFWELWEEAGDYQSPSGTAIVICAQLAV